MLSRLIHRLARTGLLVQFLRVANRSKRQGEKLLGSLRRSILRDENPQLKASPFQEDGEGDNVNAVCHSPQAVLK